MKHQNLKKRKPEIRANKKKLKKPRKDFDELRHKFSKKEIDTEKLFMLFFKKFRGDYDSVDYEDLDN